LHKSHEQVFCLDDEEEETQLKKKFPAFAKRAAAGNRLILLDFWCDELWQ